MIVFGLILLVASGAAFYFAFEERKKARRATATETLKCAEVAALSQGVADEVGGGNFSQRCEAVGAAAAGPDGLIKAPESGLDVVWAHTKITHKYWVMKETRDSDGDMRRQRDEREEVVSENTTTTAFAIKDDTGSVLVHPDGSDMDKPERVSDRFERAEGQQAATSIKDGLLKSLMRAGADSGTIGFQHEEWAVRPGTRLYVHGEVADRTGKLVFTKPSDGGTFMISTRSEEEIVSGAERNAKLGAAGGVLAIVVGLGLIVAGLVS